jgi:hypothetical protein
VKLYEIQKRFKHQILSSVPSETPLEVHRHHTFYTLKKTLSGTFGQTKKFLGEKEFSKLAESFIENSPPSNPYLCLYGKEFPNLLENSLLRNLASVEWCLQESLNAYEESRDDFLAKLTRVNPDDFDQLTFVVNSNLRIFRSVYNLKPLFTKDSLSEGDFFIGEFYFLCKTVSAVAQVVEVPLDQGIFLEALSGGSSLGYAHDQALKRNKDFDLEATLTYHFQEKNFIDFS